MSEIQPIIQVQNIGKSFGATRALNGVSVDFLPGEILAMVGANGAGKSTLIKVICGYYNDYEGMIRIEGREIQFTTPKDSYESGIATVHQIINQGVVPSMTVYENLTLAELLKPGQSVFYDKNELRQRARQVAQVMDLHLDMDVPVEDLTQSERQMIAIARALAANPKLLILDEPTSSLSEKEADRLFKTLERLKITGVSILYVSHRLHEISRIADRVVVIRDGELATTLKRPFQVREMVNAMVGEIPKHSEIRFRTHISHNTTPVIEIRDLIVQKGDPPINLTIRAGEILGLTGLIGAGKSELAQVLFGIQQWYSGSVMIRGREVQCGSMYEAIRQGIFYVPEDRSNNAVVPLFNVRQNMTLPFLRIFQRFGMMKIKREQKRVKDMIRAMRIKCEGPEAEIDSLSGGNQQKVVVARWLLEPYQLVILDEPFQGVDIRSRHDMAEYLRATIGDQAAIIIATDLDEVIEVADRIVVMNHGAILGEQPYDKIDREQLLHWIAQEQPSNREEIPS